MLFRRLNICVDHLLPDVRNQGEARLLFGGVQRFHPRRALLVLQLCQGYKQCTNPYMMLLLTILLYWIWYGMG